MKDHQMISLFKYSLCVICVVWDGIQVGRVGVLGFTLMKRVFMLPILLIRRTSAAIVFLACLASASVSVAQVPDWPDLYDPFTLYTLNVETVNADDFDLIRNDTTYDIEVPAWFWAESEEPILVSIRRKSASALPNELDPNKKVSYKIDINEYHDAPDDVDVCVDVPGITEGCVSKWKAVKKLSLENGDDQNIADEGVAWYLHRLASESGLDYQTGLASWVKLYINGQYQGVYVNVEQPDKQFLKNRNLWEVVGDTWLTKMSYQYIPEPKDGPEDDFGIPSPTSEALCFLPFVDLGRCSTPDDFKAQLEARINMEGMLTFGAVSAFHYSPDDLFAKGKNFYYADQGFGLSVKREYFQWDLDSAFGSKDPGRSIYRTGRGKHNQYEKALVESEEAPFRAEYNDIIDTLINGASPVFDAGQLTSDLQAFRDLLSDALAADPNDKGAAGAFDTLSQYLALRIDSMRDQLPAALPPPGEEGQIHVGELDGSAVSTGSRNWDAIVTVTVHNYLHEANVSGASVTGSWSHGLAGDTTCVTNDSGQCQLRASVTSMKYKKITFTVGSVSAPTDIYLAAQNHNDVGDSDGNSISIASP